MGRKRKRRESDGPASQLKVCSREIIHKLFEKKFSYTPDSKSWTLPAEVVSSVASENTGDKPDKKMHSSWRNEELMKLKRELNDLKTQLNDKDLITWHQHTGYTNLAGNINGDVRKYFRPELCTQAWCKFYEVVSSYPILDLNNPALVTVHLCEAPGAFISSLNHYLVSQDYTGVWEWRATTLNPYYEGNRLGQMIDDDRFIRCSYGNWHFGKDRTGNIMDGENLTSLHDLMKDIGRVNLVTADGSIDCQDDPAEQENVVSQLLYTEMLTALTVLDTGGCFIMKTFTLFEDRSICMMFLLNCVFEKVEVFKPCTSKGGNSETYVVCSHYRGTPSQDFMNRLCQIYFNERVPAGCIFKQEMVPSSFLEQHISCCKLYKDFQSDTIQLNLDLYEKMTDEGRQELEEMKNYCSEHFFNVYSIAPMSHQARLMKTRQQRRTRKAPLPRKHEGYKKHHLKAGKFTGTFDERTAINQLPWQQRLQQFETYDVIQEDMEIVWLENQHGPLSAEDVSGWGIVNGKPIEAVNSSRFCDVKLVQQTQELLQHVQVPVKNHQAWGNQNLQAVVGALISAITLGKGNQLDEQLKPWYSADHEELSQALYSYKHSDVLKKCRIEDDSDGSVAEKMRWSESSEKSDTKNTLQNEDQRKLQAGIISDCDVIKLGVSETLVDETSEDSTTGNVAGLHSSNTLSRNKCFCDKKCAFDHSPQNQSDESTSINIVTVSTNTENVDARTCKSTTDSRKTYTCSCHQGTNESTNINKNQCTNTSSVCIDVNTNCTGIDRTVASFDSTFKPPEQGLHGAEHRTIKNSCTCRKKQKSVEIIVKSEQPHKKSIVFCSLMEQVSGNHVFSADHRQMVTCYCVRGENVTPQLDISDQCPLLMAILDILKTCPPGGRVLLELGLCLSRLTAGLLYVLYRSFQQIGYSGPLVDSNMAHYLVCTGFTPPTLCVIEYLKGIDLSSPPLGSASVLEVIPVLDILADCEFTEFLQRVNDRLLKMFITSVVKSERRAQNVSSMYKGCHK